MAICSLLLTNHLINGHVHDHVTFFNFGAPILSS